MVQYDQNTYDQNTYIQSGIGCIVLVCIRTPVIESTSPSLDCTKSGVQENFDPRGVLTQLFLNPIPIGLTSVGA